MSVDLAGAPDGDMRTRPGSLTRHVTPLLVGGTWLCSLFGWLFAASGGAYLIWALAFVSAAAALALGRSVVVGVGVVAGLMVGPGLFAVVMVNSAVLG